MLLKSRESFSLESFVVYSSYIASYKMLQLLILPHFVHYTNRFVFQKQFIAFHCFYHYDTYVATTFPEMANYSLLVLPISMYVRISTNKEIGGNIVDGKNVYIASYLTNMSHFATFNIIITICHLHNI